jgi:hypothetical protein
VTPEQEKPVTAVQPGALATRGDRTVVFVVRDGVTVSPIGASIFRTSSRAASSSASRLPARSFPIRR